MIRILYMLKTNDAFYSQIVRFLQSKDYEKSLWQHNNVNIAISCNFMFFAWRWWLAFEIDSLFPS